MEDESTFDRVHTLPSSLEVCLADREGSAEGFDGTIGNQVPWQEVALGQPYSG